MRATQAFNAFNKENVLRITETSVRGKGRIPTNIKDGELCNNS